SSERHRPCVPPRESSRQCPVGGGFVSRSLVAVLRHALLAQSYVSVNNMEHTLNTAGSRAILAMQGSSELIRKSIPARGPCVGRGPRRAAPYRVFMTPACVVRVLMGLAVLALVPCVFAEDGYDLWLRYVLVQTLWLAPYRSGTTQLVLSTEAPGSLTPTLTAARDELNRGLAGLLGAAPPSSPAVTQDGALLL